eukprot:3528582-Rhodomonas_salina.1
MGSGEARTQMARRAQERRQWSERRTNSVGSSVLASSLVVLSIASLTSHGKALSLSGLLLLTALLRGAICCDADRTLSCTHFSFAQVAFAHSIRRGTGALCPMSC